MHIAAASTVNAFHHTANDTQKGFVNTRLGQVGIFLSELRLKLDNSRWLHV
jgi:hypothetical protein